MLASHTPKQNHLLAALPAADYERLLPDLNRPKLEKRVCECYSVVKRETDRLLSHKTAIADRPS